MASFGKDCLKASKARSHPIGPCFPQAPPPPPASPPPVAAPASPRRRRPRRRGPRRRPRRCRRRRGAAPRGRAARLGRRHGRDRGTLATVRRRGDWRGGEVKSRMGTQLNSSETLFSSLHHSERSQPKRCIFILKASGYKHARTLLRLNCLQYSLMRCFLGTCVASDPQKLQPMPKFGRSKAGSDE